MADNFEIAKSKLKTPIAKKSKKASTGYKPTRLNKTASTGGFSGGQVVRVNPKPYSPIFNESYLMLPRDRREMNAWCRHFYITDPIIRNALDLHARYPLSKFTVRCPHKKVRGFFDEMLFNMNFYQTVLEIGLEYWMIGEVFPEAELNHDTGMWNHVSIHNPDYIDVKSSNLTRHPVISLIPDDELRRICTSSNPIDIEIRNQLLGEHVEYIQRGLNIPLDNFQVSHIANKASPYNIRGTSILECLFKDLMLRDKYREAQYVIADDHITPLRIFKIGDEKYRPNEEDLLAFRDLLEEATYDPNFVLVYHSALTVEYMGSNSVIMDLTSEYERIERMLFTGLFTSSNMLTGEGPGYSNNGEVAIDILTQRYVSFRQQISHWIEKKIFEPISKIQGFFEYEDGEEKLIVPTVSWQKINLRNSHDYIEVISGLAENKKVSYQTLFSILDLDLDEELRKVTEEQEKFARLANAGKEPDESGADSGNILGDLGPPPPGGGADMGMPDMGEASGDLSGDLSAPMEGGGIPGGDLGGGEAPPSSGEPMP